MHTSAKLLKSNKGYTYSLLTIMSSSRLFETRNISNQILFLSF